MNNHLGKQLYPEKIDKIKGVMIFVVDRKKNLLLLKRKDNKKWEPIKGGINVDENWIKATRRELKEETGIDINKENIKHLRNVTECLINGRGDKITVDGVVSYIIINELAPEIDITNNNDDEHENYKWESLTCINDIDIYPPSAKSSIERLLKKFKI